MYYTSLDITVTTWKTWIYIGQEMGLEHFFFYWEWEEASFIYVLGELYCFSIATRINHHWLNCLNQQKSVTSDLYQLESRYLSAGLCCFLNYYEVGFASAHVCSWYWGPPVLAGLYSEGHFHLLLLAWGCFYSSSKPLVANKSLLIHHSLHLFLTLTSSNHYFAAILFYF